MRFIGSTPASLYGGGFGFNPQPEPPARLLRPAPRWRYVGATPASFYQGGMAALGVVVPTPLPGQPTFAPDMKETGYNYCGSKFGFQQMLKDLGFYKGTIDGQVGAGTISAASAFGKQYGVPISGGLSNTFCAKLIQVWSSQFGQPAALAPAPAPQLPSQDVPPPPEGRPTNGQPPAPRNGGGTQPGTQNGNGTTAAPGGAAVDKAKGWWASQGTGTKAAVAIGGVALLGLIGYALASSGKKKSYTANRSTRKRSASRRLTASQKAALGRIKGKRRRAPTGKITTLKSGKRYGHLKPPKQYWKKGAKRPSDYADPEHYKYPLVFRNPDGSINRKRSAAHTRAAQSYFARHKRRYSMATRRKIARNINKAKKRFDIGGKKVKP